MTEADYACYLAAFNGRDYDALHAFFADDVVLETVGYALRGKHGIRRFYAFFHDHVRETVRLRRFAAADGIAFADVIIRFEGLKALSAQRLVDEGYARLTPVPAGAVVEIGFFIAYEFDARGITRIRCAVLEPQA